MQHEGKHEYLMDVSIEELDLPDHLIKDLRDHGLLTVGQLLSTTEEDLQRIHKSPRQTWGKRSVAKVQQALAKAGYARIPRFIPVR